MVLSGAGKTSTFGMLTGDISPTGGTAFIAGYDIRTHMRSVSIIHCFCAYTCILLCMLCLLSQVEHNIMYVCMYTYQIPVCTVQLIFHSSAHVCTYISIVHLQT